uniref:CCHC-type domain-containing protein n=1 Tax=Tanacetum cinerariifolium TaxID=118510 RepID=A0A6L2N6Q7_TANCI|nr:hypothetical protein [Tanacetum cinerariifolium]
MLFDDILDDIASMVPFKANGVTFEKSQPSSPQYVNEDLEKIHTDDLVEVDLRWQMATLTMRARKFLKKKRKKLTVNGNDTIGFDKSNVECYNCYKRGHFTRECRAPRSQDTNHKEIIRWTIHVETPTSTALVSCDGLSGYDWSNQAEEGPNYALMAYTSTSSDSMVSTDSTCTKSCLETVKILKSQNEQLTKEDIKLLKVEIQMKDIPIIELKRKLEVAQKENDGIQLTVKKLKNASKSLNKLIDCQIVDNFKKELSYESYNAVLPPYTRNFMPPKPDLSYIGLDEFADKQ